MKKQGVPTTDPEFIKTQSILAALQRQNELRKQLQMQQQHQLQQQQAQAMQNGANGLVNGGAPARPPQPAAAQTTTIPAATSLGASALPAAANASASAANAAPSQSQSSQFSQAQLNLLWTQIKAFRMLGKNAGVPIQMQK